MILSNAFCDSIFSCRDTGPPLAGAAGGLILMLVGALGDVSGGVGDLRRDDDDDDEGGAGGGLLAALPLLLVSPLPEGEGAFRFFGVMDLLLDMSKPPAL